MRLYSNHDRPFHLGPLALERLSRLAQPETASGDLPSILSTATHACLPSSSGASPRRASREIAGTTVTHVVPVDRIAGLKLQDQAELPAAARARIGRKAATEVVRALPT